MSAVLVGIGSNIEPERHLRAAARMLRQRFGGVRFSAVYRSPAVGMEGDDFLNACALIETDLGDDALVAVLKSMERDCGRKPGESWRPRTLDLDLLMRDGRILDDDVLRQAHVWYPAKDLTPLPEVVLSGEARWVDFDWDAVG
ncbi:MAG: 2-amino-4-hydroxy-6-hydroxymethyldihydropteridine diphosphokinase [Mariprofundaceae bacterium]